MKFYCIYFKTVIVFLASKNNRWPLTSFFFPIIDRHRLIFFRNNTLTEQSYLGGRTCSVLKSVKLSIIWSIFHTENKISWKQNHFKLSSIVSNHSQRFVQSLRSIQIHLMILTSPMVSHYPYSDANIGKRQKPNVLVLTQMYLYNLLYQLHRLFSIYYFRVMDYHMHAIHLTTVSLSFFLLTLFIITGPQ